MRLFAETAERIAATTKKSEKVAILAEYLHSRSVEEAAVSAVFFSGRVFPASQPTTLQVGSALLWEALRRVSGKSETAMAAAYRRHGDLGSAAQELLRTGALQQGSLSVMEVAEELRGTAQAQGTAAKLALLRQLVARVTPVEAKYIIKIIGGEMRIGLRESLVEEAIARAYLEKPQEIQRVNMLLGDIAETLRLAAGDRLDQARMRLFHPLGFMLASPVESAEEGFQYFQQAQVEDKYDGIRAQAHVDAEARVRLFSRTLDDITGSFPELAPALAALPAPAIFDGEIVAWQRATAETVAHTLPFSELQKRLGRKRVTPGLMRRVPVAYIVFDVLYALGKLVIGQPLAERRALLEDLFARRSPAPAGRLATTEVEDVQGWLRLQPSIVSEGIGEQTPQAGEAAGTEVLCAPVAGTESAEDLERMFAEAQARGNEGLVIKDLGSPYAAGRRGRSWLKLKRELATLDVVVTAVQWGHGKRAGVLSDVTFAVRDEDRLLNVGKAYSGLTDKEIAELTQWFLEHTTRDQGFLREVEPKLVLEIAFNAVMRSDRHGSGYALRFPRILRIRRDKPPQEADTLERVQQIYERQGTRQGG